MIIKYAIFSEPKNVLRLRRVDSYFKFVVDEELFSVISNQPETIALFGRNYFSGVTRYVGDFIWWPRNNQYKFNWFYYSDYIEAHFSFICTKIYSGFETNLLMLNNSLPRAQMISKIEEIFHPINEYAKRLSYCFSQWFENHQVSLRQPKIIQKKGYLFNFDNSPIDTSTFSWRCHLIFGLGQDFSNLSFIKPKLKKNYKLSSPKFRISKDIFSALLKSLKLQIVPYTTIHDFYPNLIHIFPNPPAFERHSNIRTKNDSNQKSS
jgi:hypothetical protein